MRRSQIFLAFFCFTIVFFLVLINPALKAQTSQTTTPRPLPTPRPPNNDLLPILQKLLEKPMEDCILPCFWGVEPNETTTSEMLEIVTQAFAGNEFIHDELEYETEGEVEGKTIRYRQFTLIFEPAGTFLIGFSVDEKSQIDRVDLAFSELNQWLETPHMFELSQLFAVLGTPADIFVVIAIYPTDTSEQFFYLYVGYPDKAVLVVYEFKFEDEEFTFSDQPLQLCPRHTQNLRISVTLQSPDNNDHIKESWRELDDPTISYGRSSWSVKDLLGIDVETFTQIILQNPDECIEAPSYNELKSKGFRF